MTVATILKGKGTDTITVPEDHSVADVVAILAEKGIGAVLVVGADGAVVGILSERDVVRALHADGPDAISKPASALMTRNVEFCTPADTANSVMARMTEGRFRHMPVFEGGDLVGVISIGDIVKSRINQLENETSAMRDYIAGHG